MNFIKRISPFEVILVAVILGTHLYAAFSDAYNFPNKWFMRDDAYYYFKVAQNISEGMGSTFDGINPTNGYHPLWMLVCIPVFALARFDLILPLRVLLMVTAVLNAATAVLFYRLVKDNLSHAVAMLAASFWAFSSQIHFIVYKPGLETPLAAFTVILFIYKFSQFEREWRSKPVEKKQIAVLAACAVIVMFSRLDLVFLAVIGGIWIVFRDKPIRYFLPLDMVIIFGSMTFSIALRTGILQYNTTYANSAVEAVALMLVVKIVLLYLLGGYQHRVSIWAIIQQTGLAITSSSIIAAGFYLMLVQLGVGKSFPRSAFFIDWCISFMLILSLRLVTRFGSSDHRIAQTTSPLMEFRTSWVKWLTEGTVYYGIVGGALGLYMLYNQIAFGTSSPVSGQIKRWWGSLINTVYESPAPDWTSFFGISFQGAFDAWRPASSLLIWMGGKIYPLYPGSARANERYFIAMFAVVLLTLIIFLLNSRRTKKAFSNMALIPLMAGCGIQILSYTTTAYGGVKEWYWVSEMVLLILAGSLLLDLLLRPLRRIKLIHLTLEIAAIASSIFLAYQFTVEVKSSMRYNHFPLDRPFMEVLPYLEENTRPGAIIGMTGGGNVGYFIHDRTIVNMDGLINSHDYFRALQNGEAAVYLRQRGMTVVFASPRLLGLLPYDGQFAPYFENYSQYGGKNLMYLLEEPKYQP